MIFMIGGALLRVETCAGRSQLAGFHRAIQACRKTVYRSTMPRAPRRSQAKKEPPPQPEPVDLLKSLQEKAKAKEKLQRKPKYTKFQDTFEGSDKKGALKETSPIGNSEIQEKNKEKELENVSEEEKKSESSKYLKYTEKPFQSVSGWYSWLKGYFPKYLASMKQEASAKESKQENENETSTLNTEKSGKDSQKTLKK